MLANLALASCRVSLREEERKVQVLHGKDTTTAKSETNAAPGPEDLACTVTPSITRIRRHAPPPSPPPPPPLPPPLMPLSNRQISQMDGRIGQNRRSGDLLCLSVCLFVCACWYQRSSVIMTIILPPLSLPTSPFSYHLFPSPSLPVGVLEKPPRMGEEDGKFRKSKSFFPPPPPLPPPPPPTSLSSSFMQKSTLSPSSLLLRENIKIRAKKKHCAFPTRHTLYIVGTVHFKQNNLFKYHIRTLPFFCHTSETFIKHTCVIHVGGGG